MGGGKRQRLRKSGRNLDKWGAEEAEESFPLFLCLVVLFIVELLSEPAAHGRDERRSFAAAVL